MKWTTLCCLLWMAATSAVADSDTVDSKVWERLINRCTSHGEYIDDDNLPDYFIDEVPENAKAVARRARRCQDRVRRRMHRVARQCLEEKRVRELRRGKTDWAAGEHHRITQNAVYFGCPDQHADLLESYDECCTVIPGY